MSSSRLWIGALLVAAAGCAGQPAVQPLAPGNPIATKPAAAKIEKLDSKHLPNPVRVHEKVVSGGLPEGEAAFAELARLGIKTVISVDGAKPDVATAAKHGMRYVHLPHGYDGIPATRAMELAKAVRDLPGPVYIHCHHGKHRSPAATAIACIGAGLIPKEAGAILLRVAGTAESYRGLFQSTEQANVLDKALLDALPAEFPSVAKLPAMAEAMVEIERIHDRLQSIEQAGWKTPADQPALVPEHEALLLREQFTELLRTKELQGKPAKFQELAKEAESLGLALEEALKRGADSHESTKRLAAVSNNCKACHAAFRDVPLGEK